MSTITDLFNPMGVNEKEQKNSDIYRVNFKEGKGNIYKSVVRFVPWYVDPRTNIMKKYVSYVKNPISNMGMYVDDPKSLDDNASAVSPVNDMYWKLINTKVATYEDIAKKYLSSKLQYASLVQIMQDEQHPELVGKIKVFVYGKKVWEKLYAEEHPAVGEGINPFHPVYGRKFSIVCTSQSNFNNFDQSMFYDERVNGSISPSGLWYIDPATNQYAVVNENTNQEVLFNYLAANSPDLSKYAAQPWSEQQTSFVNEVLEIVQNYITTGSFAKPGQIAMQQSINAINGNGGTFANPMGMAVNSNPVFPGATVQPMAVPQQSQFPGVAQPQFPSAIPQQPVVPQPSVTPQPVVPQPIAMPQPSVVPQTVVPQPMVSGVEPPVVTPQATAPQADNKPQVQTVGVNVDDILSQL